MGKHSNSNMSSVAALGLLGASAVLLLVCAPAAEGTIYHLTHHSSPCHNGISSDGYKRAYCLASSPLLRQATDVYSCVASQSSPRCHATAAPSQYCDHQSPGRCPGGTSGGCPGEGKGLSDIMHWHNLSSRCSDAGASDITGAGDEIVLVWEKSFWHKIAPALGAKGMNGPGSNHNEVWTWSSDKPEIKISYVERPDGSPCPDGPIVEYNDVDNATHMSIAPETSSLYRFRAWQAEYNKTYATPQQENHRLGVFLDNLAEAERFQQIDPTAAYGETQFSDLTKQEFSDLYLRSGSVEPLDDHPNISAWRPTREFEAVQAADSINWADQGKVADVKDQGHCGSCWSFAFTGNAEGQLAIKTNTDAISLSEEVLISCDKKDCHGSSFQSTVQWVMNNNGGKCVTDAAWPYSSGNQHVPACKDYHTMDFSGVITGGTYNIGKMNENQMMQWVSNNGPLAIDIAAYDVMHHYKHGTIMNNCFALQGTDHAMLITGYNTNTNGDKYWIVKNSWGTKFGNDGYLWIKMGSNCRKLASQGGQSVQV